MHAPTRRSLVGLGVETGAGRIRGYPFLPTLMIQPDLSPMKTKKVTVPYPTELLHGT